MIPNTARSNFTTHTKYLREYQLRHTTMSEIHLPLEQQPSSATSSRRPSGDYGTLSKKTSSREPLKTLFEEQGIKPTETHSAPSSRRPSISVAISTRRDSGTSSRRPSIPVSLESSAPGTPNIRYPSDFPPMTPPPKTPTTPQPPPIPDFDSPPYAKPIGHVFEGDEWDPLVERLEDKVIKVLVACESLARCLNMPVQRLRPTGLHFNILALDELTIVEITRDCWWIMYEIISEGLGWVDLLNRKRWLLERLKRNVRQSQPETRWDVPCDILISLGFKDPWIYKDTDEQ